MGWGWGENLRGWGGDGEKPCGDGEGMGKTYLLRGGDGDEIVSPCHSLVLTLFWRFLCRLKVAVIISEGRRKLEPVAIVVLAVIMSFVSVQVIHESVQKIVVYATKDYSQQLKRIKEWSATEAAVNLTEDSNGTASDSEAISFVMELVRLLEDCSRGNHAPVFETPTIVICIATVGRPKITIILVCVNFNFI